MLVVVDLRWILSAGDRKGRRQVSNRADLLPRLTGLDPVLGDRGREREVTDGCELLEPLAARDLDVLEQPDQSGAALALFRAPLAALALALGGVLD